ncbi:MAG: segregation/condensation protein A [Polyangiaceae bacterium]
MTSPPEDAAAKGPDLAKTDGVSVGRGGVSYTVQLPNFEGPLDLLLHLIQQHELDVLDIPIAFVTEKYVEYILLMQELNIDIASEYLVMAATLAHIKSKTLLPSVPEDQEDSDEPEIDPRADLVRRLLEYQKYKLVAEQLADRSVFGRDVFARGVPAPQAEGTAPLAPVSLFKLLDAFQGVLTRAKTVIDHEIELDRLSITDRINQLADRLRDRTRVAFEELFEGQLTRADLILTFLALLEMTRLRMTRLIQDGPLEPIVVELSVSEQEGTDVAPEGATESTEQAPMGGEVALASPPEETIAADVDTSGAGEAVAIAHVDGEQTLRQVSAGPELPPEAESPEEAQTPADVELGSDDG